MSEHHNESEFSRQAGPDGRRRQDGGGAPSGEPRTIAGEPGAPAGATLPDDRGAEAGGVAYAKHLEAFGAELRRVATRRRRRRTGRLVVAGAGAFAAAAAVIVLASSPGAGPVDVVARAEAALAPRGELLHYVVRTSVGSTAAEGETQVSSSGYGCSPSGPTEVWQATQPRRWRVVSWPRSSEAKCGRYVGRDGREIVGPQELAYADGTTTAYIREHGTLETIRGYATTGAASIVPYGNSELGSGDPVTAVQRMLAAGQLRDRGVRAVAGRQVRVLTGHHTEGPRKYRGVRETTYLVDAKTFEPVRSIQKFVPSVRARGDGLLAATQQMAFQVDFDRFERRPLDVEGERQLVIRPGLVVKKTDVTVQELRREMRERERTGKLFTPNRG